MFLCEAWLYWPDMTTQTEKKGRIPWGLLRILLGFGLAAFFIHKIISDKLGEAGAMATFKDLLANASWPWMTMGVLTFGGLMCIGFFRWWLLLRVQRVNLPLLQIVRLGMIGNFFNMCIPGAVSGDVVKMVYVHRHAKGRTTEAVLAIMLDRVIGLAGLLVVVTVSCVLNYEFLKTADAQIGPMTIQEVTGVVGLACVCGITGIVCLFFQNALQKLPGVKPLIGLGERMLPKGLCETIGRLVVALELYKQRKVALLCALLLSIAVHTCTALAMLAVARGIHEDQVKVSGYFLMTQISNTVSSIPVSPAGFGIRDIVVSEFMMAFGAAEAHAAVAPIFMTIIIAFWYLQGSIFFAFSRTKQVSGEEGGE
ncbi:hypothetical protein BVY04_05065 [bacterium M21]|nr:hypothetical protein BVY04_05065 [bacterium M21]